jgi:hypothetical protein
MEIEVATSNGDREKQLMELLLAPAAVKTRVTGLRVNPQNDNEYFVGETCVLKLCNYSGRARVLRLAEHTSAFD